MQKGTLEGHEEGRLEDARDGLPARITVKFGELPNWVEEEIAEADQERLRGWMRDLLFADSLGGLFKN